MKFAWAQPNKGAEAARVTMCQHLLSLPKSLRRGITHDNGAEFAQHHLINQATGSKSHFCHTHSPWQKGGVENAIGRMRGCLPRNTKISEMSHHEISAITARHDTTPRKCLGYLTPMETWTKCIKSSTVALQA